MSDEGITAIAVAVGQQLHQRGWKLATAESCTGGWVAKVITDIPGSSAWLERGFVTYSNAAKQELLGVTEETLIRYGAVSAATVSAMAQGAIMHSHAAVALAVSGIAGPDGGTPDKPVGTVWFAWALPECETYTHCRYFGGDRKAVRYQAVQYALLELLEILAEQPS